MPQRMSRLLDRVSVGRTIAMSGRPLVLTEGGGAELDEVTHLESDSDREDVVQSNESNKDYVRHFAH